MCVYLDLRKDRAEEKDMTRQRIHTIVISYHVGKKYRVVESIQGTMGDKYSVMEAIRVGEKD